MDTAENPNSQRMPIAPRDCAFHLHALGAMLLAVVQMCSGQSTNSDTNTYPARCVINVVSANLGGCGLGATVNYERGILRRLSCSSGIGILFVPRLRGAQDTGTGRAIVANVAVHVAGLDIANNKIEADIGLAYVFAREDAPLLARYHEFPLVPSMSASYRYQPCEGGVAAGAGLSWYLIAADVRFGLNIVIGYAF